jgi:hypothetical protein
MKFTLFVVVVACVLFAGYFSINYAIEKINYEPVLMEPTLKPNVEMYPTALMFLADKQRDSYSIKNFALLIGSDSVNELSSLKVSMLIVNPEYFSNDEVKQLKANKKYLVAEINVNDNDVYSKIKEYLKSGYNGIYLSNIDAYKYSKDKDSDAKMITFIEDLSNKIKAQNNNALVLTDTEFLRNEQYINYIDGFLANNVFYENNVKQVKTVLLDDLRFVISKGKLVLNIDYSEGLNNRCNFVNQSKANKFIPFVASEELDSFVHFTCDEIKYSQ